MGCSLVIHTSEAGVGQAASENFDPSTTDKVSATKMLTLWALAIMLAVQAGALTLLEAPSLPHLHTPPVDVPRFSVVRRSSTQRSSPPRKQPAGTTGDRCAPVAKYFLSSSKLDDYLKATLPPQIEQLVKCKEVNLAGLLGQVLSIVGKSGLLSMLNVSSILNMGGSLGLDGILGKGGDDESAGLPLLSEVTGGVGGLPILGQEGLSGLLPQSLGADKNVVKGLLDSTGLSNLQQPLNDVAERVGDLKESAQDVVKSALPTGVSNALSGLLNTNMEKLLLKLHVQEVTVENMDSTVADNEIDVHAAVIAIIGGEGLVGSVFDLLAFQVYLDVTLKMAISSNNTQCVNLEVQEINIQANEVTLQMVKMVTETLPLPVPLPLNNLIPTVLTVELNDNVEKSDSCGIVLSDFNNCGNTSGLFKFQVKSASISPQGLSIFYCAKAVFDKNSVPVPGGLLPSDPKNANISLIISRTMLKEIFTQAAKQSSTTVNNLSAGISRVTYVFQPENTIEGNYQLNIRKDGESFATGQTNFIISYAFKVSKTNLIAEIKSIRSEHSVNPPEAEVEVQDVLLQVFQKFLTNLKELFQQANVPAGVSSHLINGKATVLKSNDLQAAN